MAIVPLKYRTADATRWGAGKGANLTATEVDENFFALAVKVEELEDNPPEGAYIASITVAGNKMKIAMSDGEQFGPFTLPVAALEFRGAWAAGTEYKTGNLFTQANALWYVRVDHKAEAPFNPSAPDVTGPVYQLVMPFPLAYDVGFFFPGLVGNGLAAGATMFAHKAARDFYLPAGLAGSVGELEAAATSARTMVIMRNGTAIGSVELTAGSTAVGFTFADAVQINTGDTLKVIRPSGGTDPTAAGLILTLKGVVGRLA